MQFSYSWLQYIFLNVYNQKIKPQNAVNICYNVPTVCIENRTVEQVNVSWEPAYSDLTGSLRRTVGSSVATSKAARGLTSIKESSISSMAAKVSPSP